MVWQAALNFLGQWQFTMYRVVFSATSPSGCKREDQITHLKIQNQLYCSYIKKKLKSCLEIITNTEIISNFRVRLRKFKMPLQLQNYILKNFQYCFFWVSNIYWPKFGQVIWYLRCLQKSKIYFFSWYSID